jgi:hypothetical protein
MRIGCVAFLLTSLILNGCHLLAGRSEPSYPTNVTGWKDYQENGAQQRGNFVLKKGETTDNGKIRIKVLDITAPDPFAESGTWSSLPKAQLEFVRVSDQKVLCTHTYAEREGRRLSADCGENLVEYGLLGISIRAINLKEQWVFFALSG